MTNFNFICLFLWKFSIQQAITTEYPPIIPLTNALTAIYCHDDNDAGMMTIRCGSNEKIRMLDAYDVVVKNKSHLPYQCLQHQHSSFIHEDHPAQMDCKMPTSFTSACSGRENCTLHMQRTRLNSAKDHCYDELVDYTMAFFECISDVFIHDVCSTQAITSAWGTLKTPNFPNPYTSDDDCWCKLSTQLQHRLLLSVIVFQLIPYDQQCAGAGLYLQGSDAQRSTQCTYLQQGYHYLSDTNSLYMNFYSRTSTVRGGFWIVYEANHPNAEVHLHCGPREKIGMPLSPSLPSISSIHNHGWSRSDYRHSSSSTTTTEDPTMRLRSFSTTYRSFSNRDFKITPPTPAAAAFTYPYGRLTTFELDYGPRGWFLKYLFGPSNMTATRFLQTTTLQYPVVKWNSTWRYFRRPRTRIFTTKTTTSTSMSTTTPRTTTSTTTVTSTIPTTKRTTTPTSSTTISTSPVQSTPTQTTWTYYITSNIESSTTTATTRTTTLTTNSSKPSSTSKTTLPIPTPWYPPAGPFDWWQWQWYTTKVIKTPLKISNITESSTNTTPAISTTSSTTTTTMTTISSSQKNPTTADWFQWPHLEFTSTMKEQSDYDDDDYSDWADDFVTTKIPPEMTSDSLLFFPPERPRKKFQQMNFLPSEFTVPFLSYLITSPTPIFSRYSTVQFADNILQRKTAQSQYNGVTGANQQNSVPQTVERENKKSSDENGWLNKTDLTIVGVSILFVIILVFGNLILFAVRRSRHRQQLQGQHLFSGSSVNSRRTTSTDHFQNPRHAVPIDGFHPTTTTSTNNSDILPAVGEIVLWDNQDQGGYTNNNRGEWAKIDGRQWFGNSLFRGCSKTSFSKSFRSRFQFIRQSTKKSNHRPQPSPKAPQQAYKYPLLMDTSLSPVPEVDDYRLSDISSEIAIKKSTTTLHTLVNVEQDHSDEYYKRMEIYGSESNYTTVHGHTQGEYSLADQQTERNVRHEIDPCGSVIISVPTMLRQDDDVRTISDSGDSIYNPDYSIRCPPSRLSHRHKSPLNNTIIIGHCQTDFQPLDPTILLQKSDQCLLAVHQQLYTCSQSLELSAYDSGFFDDQTTIHSDEFEQKL